MGIKIDDRVKVVACENYLNQFNGYIGRVLRIYDTTIIPVAIVALEDGSTIKVNVDNLVKYEVRETVKSEGGKKISKEDFEKALVEATDPFGMPGKHPMSNVLGSMVGVIVGHDIRDKIFKDQSAVSMTRDEFIATLWDGCSPANVNEIIDKKMPTSKAAEISISAMIVLRNLATIIFGDEADND